MSDPGKIRPSPSREGYQPKPSEGLEKRGYQPQPAAPTSIGQNPPKPPSGGSAIQFPATGKTAETPKA